MEGKSRNRISFSPLFRNVGFNNAEALLHPESTPQRSPRSVRRSPAQQKFNNAISAGIQATSILTPPILLGVTLYRHSSLRPLLHPKALLRHLSFSSLGVGIPLGLAYGVVTTPKGPLAAVSSEIKEKTIGLSQRELNFRDYSVIGGVIGALLTTTVFLRSVLYLILM